MKNIQLFLLSITPIIFYILIGVFVLKGNHQWMLPIMSLLYLLIGFFSKNKKLLLLLGLPFILLSALSLFLKDALTSIILLYLIILPICLILGWLIKNNSKLYGLAYVILIFFIFCFGFENWNSFIRNYDSRVTQNSPTIKLINFDDEFIRLDTIKNKVIVLDFWNTSCGVCFKKFPDFEKIYLEFKNNPEVLIYSVNIPIKNDTLYKTKNLVQKLGYKFPSLFANSNEIPQKLNFNTYPHLTILKNGKVKYNGRLEVSEKTKVHNLRTEIKLLLNE